MAGDSFTGAGYLLLSATPLNFLRWSGCLRSHHRNALERPYLCLIRYCVSDFPAVGRMAGRLPCLANLRSAGFRGGWLAV